MFKQDLFSGFKLIIIATSFSMLIPLYSQSSKKTQQFTPVRSLTKNDLPTSSVPKSIIREVPFTNDLSEIVELDLKCQTPTSSLGQKEQACLARFKQIPITIRAEKEYQIKDGDEINIETKHTWELSINRIPNEALLSLKTFRDIVIDHFMPKKRVSNFMDNWIWTPYNHAKLFIYQKVLAPLFKILNNKEATTTITILTDIGPYESIRCSDIILDLDQLNSEGKLTVSVNHEDLFNMHVTIKSKLLDSLPSYFF